MMDELNSGSIAAGIFWMVFLSILLFWLPVIGPLIAGLVGGKKSGGVKRALAAFLLPSFLLAVGLSFLAASLTSVPLVGAIAGAGGLILSLVHIAPLFLGALIGGLVAGGRPMKVTRW